MKALNAELFAGQEVFVGMDVHKNSWAVTELYGGNQTNTYSMKPDPLELAKHLNREYPGATFKSVYEAGFCGFWIHHELIKLNIQNMVVNAADIPTSNKEKLYKNDARDSKKLARELANGSLHPIYIPSKEQLSLRDLVRRETQIINNTTRSKNRIKSYLHLRGEKIQSWSANNLKWLHNNTKTDKDMTLFFLVDELMAELARKLAIVREQKRLIHQLGKDKLLTCLMSIPGIGIRTGILMIAEIWDMNRFKKKDKLCAYVGFAPRLVGSGEKERMKGGGSRKHRQLQSKLIEAAWRAIGVDIELRATYCQFTSRGSAQRAISVVGKKLLLRARSVWLHEKIYKLNSIPK